MMGILRSLLAGSTVTLLLQGCDGLELQRAQGLQPRGSEFDKNLYRGYIDLAKSEYDEGDYRDSDSFAGRARAIAGRNMVMPEEVAQRKLPASTAKELSDLRSRLMAALAAGAREKAPIEAARAQVMFDCWMQEQEENFQPDDIGRCRAGFMQAVVAAEEALKPERIAPASQARAPTNAPVTESSSKKFVIYFPFDSTRITPESKKAIMDAIDAAKQKNANSISIAGHTDRAGPDIYNDKLSGMRTDAVADAFVKGGGPKGNLHLASFGERRNAVKTSDGIASALNRRVEITVQFNIHVSQQAVRPD